MRRILYAPFLAHLRLSHHFSLGSALAGLVLEDVAGDQLAVVLVGRDHIYIHTGSGAAARHRANHVVGLEAVHHQHRNVQGLHYRRQRLQGVDYQLRSLAAVGLVGRVHRIAESPPRGVEADSEVRGPLLLNQFQKVFSEAEKYRSINPFGVHHRAPQKGIIHLEYERVAVYQKQFHIVSQK